MLPSVLLCVLKPVDDALVVAVVVPVVAVVVDVPVVVVRTVVLVDVSVLFGAEGPFRQYQEKSEVQVRRRLAGSPRQVGWAAAF